MPNIIANVSYQIHLPTSAGIGTPDLPGDADVYRRGVQEAIVVFDGTDAGIASVVANNVTLATGEVVDILQVTQVPLGDKPVFQ